MGARIQGFVVSNHSSWVRRCHILTPAGSWGITMIAGWLVASLALAQADGVEFHAFVGGAKIHEWSVAAQRTDRQGASEEDFRVADQYLYYVEGVYDSLSQAGRICAPGNGSAGQIQAMVTKYVNAHPDQWHEAGPVLIYRALHKTFSCSSK